MPRRVRGDRAFKRLIKRLPDAARQEIAAQLEVAGQQELAAEQGSAAFRTGALRRALSYKVYPKTLRLVVGLIGKPINRKLFYGRIVEFGRKAQTVMAARRHVLATVRPLGGRANNFKALALKNKVKGAYRMRIRGMAPRHFVYRGQREAIYAPFRAIWDRALSRAAAGASDD